MKMSFSRVTALAAAPLLLLAVGAGAVGAGAVGAESASASGTPPPPNGFEAQSASFTSAQTGFVLGARHCSVLPCPALLEKTVNGGKSWTANPVPRLTPALSLVQPFTVSPRTAVSTVRFENSNDGWLFNPGLWATTDGGRQWKRVSLPGMVTMLAAADGEVFAVSQPPDASSSQARLYKSAVGSNTWTLVPRVAPQITLTVFGHSVWTGLAPSLWTSTNSGRTWIKLRFKCPAAYPSPSAVAAASPKNVAIACSNQGDPQPGFSYKEVLVSANGGLGFHPVAAHPGTVGEVNLLAMPVAVPQVITLAASSGASYLYQTFNGGKTWPVTTYTDAGLGFRDLAYVTGSTGYVIHFGGIPELAYTLGLMKTANAGKTWTRVAIP